MPSSMLLFFVIVVGIPVVVGVLGEVAKRWIKLKETQMVQTADMAAEKAVAQAAHIEKLESRVRVLERIATDKGVHLADEIDALDTPRIN